MCSSSPLGGGFVERGALRFALLQVVGILGVAAEIVDVFQFAFGRWLCRARRAEVRAPSGRRDSRCCRRNSGCVPVRLWADRLARRGWWRLPGGSPDVRGPFSRGAAPGGG